jgi:hypothetical protein
MPYNANIPQPTDQLSVSQGQILDNFIDVSSLVNINHVNFDLADAGKHKWVTFPSQAAIPTPPFLVGEVELYNIVNATTAVNELYVQKGPGGTPIPMTASVISGNNGWTYLPSGFKFIGGRAQTSAGNNGTATIVFNNTAAGGITGFPGFNNVLAIHSTRIDPAAPGQTYIVVKSFNNAQVVFANVGGGTASTFFWSAIGN